MCLILCAIMLSCLFMPAGLSAAYAEEGGDGAVPAVCSESDGCTATEHKTTCPKSPDYKAPDGGADGAVPAVCSESDDCTATEHKTTCPKSPDYKAPDGGADGAAPAVCSESDDCTATEHKTTCPKSPDYKAPDGGADGTAPAVCSESDDCTATEHTKNCPKHIAVYGGEAWTDQTLSATAGKLGISVRGKMPEGARLVPAEVSSASGEDGSFTYVYILKLVTVDGEVQTDVDSSGTEYTVTVTPEAGSEFDGELSVKQNDADVSVSGGSFTVTGLGRFSFSGKLKPSVTAAAKIVETGIEYETLDKAIAAAEDGQTVELLADCETAGIELRKNLIIDGGESGYAVSFKDKGIALWGKALTFNNCRVVMTGIGSTPYTGEWNWQAICASANASLTLNNTTMTMDGTGTDNAHAIYFCSNNKLNLNGSSLTIKNYNQDAIEWNDGDGGYNVNITNSTFLSDNNRSGFTGTLTINIVSSNVDVINSSSNGSNGSNFDISGKSVVNFSNNGAHGLSAGSLTINDSTVTANGNSANGIHVAQALSISNGANITIQNNRCSICSRWTLPGALYIAGTSTITGSTVTITNNLGSGIFQKSGTLTIDPSATVTITNNRATQFEAVSLPGYGGGINANGSSVSLPENLVMYNNHADKGGDDIFASANTSFNLGTPAGGRSWKLDATQGTNDCLKDIDGWYDDAEGTRWTTHQLQYHAEKVMPGTLSAPIALKAAHGILTRDIYEPAEISFFKLDSATGAPLQGAQFTAYSDAECRRVIGTAVSDNDGIVNMTVTPDSYPFTFYMKETRSPSGYLDVDDVFTVVLQEGTANDPRTLLIDGEATIVSTHSAAETYSMTCSEMRLVSLTDSGYAILNDEYVSITVNKVWIDKGHPHPSSVSVNLLANGEVCQRIILSYRNDWTSEVFNLPVYDEDGDAIEYSIVETSRIANYKPSYDGFTVYNTYRPGYIPATGDSSNIGLWIGIMAGCAVCAGGIYLIIRKRSAGK